MASFISRLFLGLFGLAIGAAVASAQPEWSPFGQDGPAGLRQDPRPAPAQRPTTAPTTSQFVLLSRATDEAMGAAIRRYERIVANGGWQAVPQGPALRLGARDGRVQLLRRRLQASGDLAPGNPSSGDFDHAVHEALVRFQSRHGLTPSGEVNSFTLAALNVAAEHRLSQLRANRQRLREAMASTSGQTYVMVNIPAYELQAVSGGQLQLTSRVVVGRPETPTPVLGASARAVNFLPYWHVPDSIANRALIPAIKKDPGYLRREHIRVFASWGGTEIDPAQVNWWAPQGQRYVFRQDPGPHNALGLIRIDMPNRHIVYMHDTPLKRLYEFHLRPYSAGCIRVERVQELAEWLLRNEAGWNRARIDQTLRSGRQATADLSRAVPVHLIYVSAWATGEGVAHFRPDIYRKDGIARAAEAVEVTAVSEKVEP